MAVQDIDSILHIDALRLPGDIRLFAQGYTQKVYLSVFRDADNLILVYTFLLDPEFYSWLAYKE